MSQVTIPLFVALLAAFWFLVARRYRAINPGTFKLALVGGMLAVVLALAIIVVIVLQVTVSAAIAIPMFVALIVEFGLIIALASRTVSGRVSRNVYLISILAVIAGILIGIVLMFQPWTPVPFNLGFDLVLISLLTFIVWSHVTPGNSTTR